MRFVDGVRRGSALSPGDSSRCLAAGNIDSKTYCTVTLSSQTRRRIVKLYVSGMTATNEIFTMRVPVDVLSFSRTEQMV